MQQKFRLWESYDVEITYYRAYHRATRACVVILPGGGYQNRESHEGEGFAGLINTFGMDAAVVDYRVAPNRFPLPLLDSRRAVRFIRHHSEELGIDKNKILIMGASAGAHLASLTSTYLDKIEGEGVDGIDNEDFIPNGQILCYPVISSDEEIYHKGSFLNLLGDRFDQKDSFSTDRLVSKRTPATFIWHTASDPIVNVSNSYVYASALARAGVPHELHVFPYGSHGLGVGAIEPHLSVWTQLLRDWLRLNGFLK
ncbi:MAG: alpha/beta hydrolase [Clostridia bacterium]|nr:alpha/beta hydrolase [Clostridia bacterium]